jgi:hypothetical protein
MTRLEMSFAVLSELSERLNPNNLERLGNLWSNLFHLLESLD